MALLPGRARKSIRPGCLKFSPGLEELGVQPVQRVVLFRRRRQFYLCCEYGCKAVPSVQRHRNEEGTSWGPAGVQNQLSSDTFHHSLQA